MTGRGEAVKRGEDRKMSFKGFSKKSKRCLAFLLAVVLFFNAWVDFEFSVFAEDGLTVTFTPESPVVYTGEDLMPTVKVEQTVSGNETSELGKEDYDIEWKNSSDEVVTEIINAGRYTATVTTKDGSMSEEETFEVKKKLERVSVNPVTKQRLLIPPKLMLTFKPSAGLKEKFK